MKPADSNAHQSVWPHRQRGETAFALWRWLAPVIALAVLVLLGWRGYAWLVSAVSQEETRAGVFAVAAHDSGSSSDALAANPGESLRPVPPLPDNPDPSLHQALCAYLVAEKGRLDHEFAQPLPPPVLDRISTLLAQRRVQAGSAQCTSVFETSKPKPAAGSR